jgi:hypothetical protein
MIQQNVRKTMQMCLALPFLPPPPISASTLLCLLRQNKANAKKKTIGMLSAALHWQKLRLEYRHMNKG